MPYLIVFSHLRWGFVYQRPQHLLSRLARHYRVVFIEEPVHDEGEARLERSSPADNVEVVVPHTSVKAGGFHDDQLSVLKPLLAEFLADNEIDDYAVWFYTPMALPLMAQLKPRAVVYDCMDELSAFQGAAPQMRQRESALLKAADLVICGGPALHAGKRDLHDNAHCLPSAVDAAHYSPANLRAGSEEARSVDRLQGSIEQPRLGFFGVIDERLDLELVAAVADADPSWQLVMVGPVVKIDPARLPQRANIHWLGMQEYKRLPYLVAGWDVCLMPFALNDSTRFISPTKTLEYMAAEKPVVSTAVPDVIGLYGHVVRISNDTPEFIAHCRSALAESAEQRHAREASMLQCVARYSWDASAEFVHGLLDAELAKTPATAPAANSSLMAKARPVDAARALPDHAILQAGERKRVSTVTGELIATRPGAVAPPAANEVVGVVAR